MKLPHLLALALVLLIAPLAARAEPFTLAIIPDVQQETSSPRFQARLQYLLDHRKEMNLAAVLQVGDLQNWDTEGHDQFIHQSTALQLLDKAKDKLPYITCLGNHDTAAVKPGGDAAPGNVNTNLRNTTTFNTFYPTTRFPLLQGTFEKDKIDNAFHTFSASDLDFLVLSLELWPRTEAVAWAKKVITDHPRHNVILVTHSFLNSGGDIEQTKGGYGSNSPQYPFDQLIKPVGNVRLTFSGHVGTHAHREDKTATGATVHSFLQCYHDNKDNPTRLIEINPAAGTLKSRVFCQSTGKDKDDNSTFTLKNLNWIPRANQKVVPTPTSAPATQPTAARARP